MESSVIPRSLVMDSRYSWIILITSFAVAFIVDGISNSFGYILIPIKDHFVVDDKYVNLLASLNNGFYSLSGPIVSGLVYKFGCRPTVMISAFLTSLFYCVCIISPSMYLMLIFYGILGGLTTGVVYITSMIVLTEYFDKKIGLATGIFMAGSGLGTSLLSIAIKLIIKLYDWKYAMTFCALLFLICSCLGVLLRPKVLKIEKKNKLIQTKNEHPESESDGNKIFQTYGGSLLSFNIASVHDDETNDSSFKSILKKIADFNLLIENKAFLMMAISNFFIWASIFLPFIYLPKLHGQNDIENYWYQNLVSIIGLTNIFFRVIFGWIFDKKIFSSLIWHLICVVFTIAIVFMFKEILQHHYFGKYLFAICYAIGTAGIMVLTTPSLIEIVGLKKFGNSIGILNIFRGTGCMVGPFLAGVISDHIPLDNIYYFIGFCFCLGCVFTFLAIFFHSKNNQTHYSDESELEK